MRVKKAILMDFDGTIADTMPIYVTIINTLGPQYGIPTITPDELESFRSMSHREFIKALRVPLYRVPFFIAKLQSEIKKRINDVQIFQGVREMLLSLKEKNYILGIITSNSEENVKKFLSLHGVDIFEFIHNERNIFGKHRVIDKVIKKFGLQKDEVLYVGDEVRDIEACKKSGVDIVAVTWGFNTKQLLAPYQPLEIINEPHELLRFI